MDVAGRQAATLIVSIVLARLLTPSDFGAMAVATFFASFAMAVVQQGLSTAVIQRQGATDEEVSGIFWWSLILSIAAAVILVAVRRKIASYFNLPILAPLMVAAAVQMVLTGLGAVHFAILNRDLRFAAIAKGGIPATIISGVVGIILAWRGAGVWALAAQLISAAAVSAAAYWIFSGWRPSAVLRPPGLADACRFARWVSLSIGLDVLYTQGFALVLGKLYGPADLGLYGRAANTQQVPASVITGIILRVALPLFAARRDDPEVLGRSLLAANRIAMVVTVPALIGLALTADLTIHVLFGPQWDQAAPVLAILSLAGVFYPLHANNVQLMWASGRSDLSFEIELVKKGIGIVAVVVGSFFGIVGLAWSQVVFSVLALIINARFSGRLFSCGLSKQLADLSGIGVAAALMAGIVTLVRSWTSFDPIAELCFVIIAGIATYLTAGALMRLQAFNDALLTVRLLRGVSQKSASQ